MRIDTAFDFRTDTPEGLDPDRYSQTLHEYHSHLWSKSLPSGTSFALEDARWADYLLVRTKVGTFYLSSDTVVPSFRSHKARAITEQLPKSDIDAFDALGYTIGGMMLFPSNRVDGRPTINGARGMHPRIADRFDLTVECIRRHYVNEDSPLTGVLARYRDFFDLFESFENYVAFWLLDDIMDGDSVRFAMPFDDFTSSPVPHSVEGYEKYMRCSLDFLTARNRRIAALA